MSTAASASVVSGVGFRGAPGHAEDSGVRGLRFGLGSRVKGVNLLDLTGRHSSLVEFRGSAEDIDCPLILRSKHLWWKKYPTIIEALRCTNTKKANLSTAFKDSTIYSWLCL